MIKQKDKSIFEEMKDWVWAHMEILGPNDCWKWKGKTNLKGYGRMGMFNREYMATRVVYEIVNGKIPTGHLICHSCDNPSCCNPAHLFAGTPKQNTDDMVSKNRHKYNNSPANPNLTEDKVREIKVLFDSGNYKQKDLAEMFGVSKHTIKHILLGHTWAWVKV